VRASSAGEKLRPLLHSCRGACKMVTMHIGRAVRVLRERRGMFQVELARRTGISKQQLSKIESGGTDPRASTFASIAEHLRVTMGEIVRLAKCGSDPEIEEPAWTPVETLVTAPIYDDIPASSARLSQGQVVGARHLDPDVRRWLPGGSARNSFWLRVRGDSMHEQTDDGSALMDRGLTLICRQAPCTNGELGVIRLPESRAVVRRI